MKFTFLGTGTSQGIPVIGCKCEVCSSDNPKDKRRRTSAHLIWDDLSINIDVGPDFRMQMLDNSIDSLDVILLTHEHNDHVAGLDDIRPFNFKQKGKIKVLGQERVLTDLRNKFDYIFSDKKYPGAPSVETISIEKNDPFSLNKTPIIPIEVLHGNLPVLGYRFDNLAYITDAKTITTDQLQKLQNLDFLVINALQLTAHHSHLTLEECLALIRTIAPRLAYITHMSHRLPVHSDLEKSLPANVLLAYDGLSIDF